MKPTLACNRTETRPGNSVTKHPQQFSLLKTPFFKSSPDLQPEYTRSEVGIFVSHTTVVIPFRTGCANLAQVCVQKKENWLIHRVISCESFTPLPCLCQCSAVCIQLCVGLLQCSVPCIMTRWWLSCYLVFWLWNKGLYTRNPPRVSHNIAKVNILLILLHSKNQNN